MLAQPYALELFYDHIPNSNKYIFTVMEEVVVPTTSTTIAISSNSAAGTLNANRVFVLPYSNCSNTSYLQVYRSDTINLTSIPSTGYRFGISRCCRLPNIINLSNPGSTGYYVEVTMYPRPGSNHANSSPRFVNPAIWQRISSLTAWHQPAYDPDGDSIYYSLADVREGTFNAPQSATYANGYGGSFPFGQNTTVNIDQELGILSAQNAPQGVYAINLVLQSYENGFLSSIVSRDIMLTLVVPSGLMPDIELTNFNLSGGASLDTSSAIAEIFLEHGDTVQFDVTGTGGITLDSVYLGATSNLLSLSLHTVGNCTANCAQLNPNPNLYGTGSATATFYYVADSAQFTMGDTASQRVILLAASQSNCQPFQYVNAFVDINLVKPQNFGLPEIELNSIDVYPNPARNFIVIHGQAGSYYELYNSAGTLILKGRCTSQKEQIATTNLPADVYFLTIGQKRHKVILQ